MAAAQRKRLSPHVQALPAITVSDTDAKEPHQLLSANTQDCGSLAPSAEEPRRKLRRSSSVDAIEQRRQRMAAGGQAVRMHTAALRSAWRTLRQELGEQCGHVDAVATTATHELSGTLYQEFRATKMPTELSVASRRSLAAQPLFTELLTKLDEDVRSVPSSALVTAIVATIAENKRLREVNAAMTATWMIAEKRCRSTCEGVLLKDVGTQRNSVLLASGQALVDSLHARIRHATAAGQLAESSIRLLHAQHQDAETEVSEVTAEIAAIKERLKQEAAHEFGMLLKQRSGNHSPVDAEEVIGRIYKRHDAWQTKWDAMSEQQRQRDEAAVLRQNADACVPCDVPGTEDALVPQPSITVMSPSVRHLAPVPPTAQHRPVGSAGSSSPTGSPRWPSLSNAVLLLSPSMHPPSYDLLLPRELRSPRGSRDLAGSSIPSMTLSPSLGSSTAGVSVHAHVAAASPSALTMPVAFTSSPTSPRGIAFSMASLISDPEIDSPSEEPPAHRAMHPFKLSGSSSDTETRPPAPAGPTALPPDSPPPQQQQQQRAKTKKKLARSRVTTTGTSASARSPHGRDVATLCLLSGQPVGESGAGASAAIASPREVQMAFGGTSALLAGQPGTWDVAHRDSRGFRRKVQKGS